jgi:tetratricopeptide (TPR) repeat protein
MPKLSSDEIRKIFETSEEFNVIFDAFEQALTQRFDDIELYRQLFWNKALSADELRMFCDKLSKEFPKIAYDAFIWLANIFVVTYAQSDNYELAFTYFKKAAGAKPNELDPYLEAADCYEPDLNIPPINTLIEFLKQGAAHVGDTKIIFERLAQLYELVDNDEMSHYYRRKADFGSSGSPGLSPA